MRLTQRWFLFSLVLCFSLMVYASRTMPCSAGRPSSAERSRTMFSLSRYGTEIAKKSDAAGTKQRNDRISANISAGHNSGLKLCWDAENRSVGLAGSSEWQSSMLDKISGSHSISKSRQQTLSKDAALYSDAVNEWSRKFNLKPDLLYAMILTESDFNPRLVSASAHGLMQVVPDTAGEEVRRWFGGNGLPSRSELFDPYTNIKYGAGYFHLLQKRYFGFVKDPLSREYCAIAAYNSGAGPIMRVFGEDRKTVASKLNAMTPDEVLASLLRRLPIKQTRMYLRKVLSSRKYFASVPAVGSAKALN